MTSALVVAEATARYLPGALCGLPSGDQFLDAHLEMKCEFVLDVAVRVETEQPKEVDAEPGSDGQSPARRRLIFPLR